MLGYLTTLLLTYGGALAALVNPFYGLMAYAALAVLKPECLWPWSVAADGQSKVVGFALIAGWALKGFGSWRLGRAWPAVASLIALSAWSCALAATSPDQEVAWNFVEHLAKIVVPVLVGVTMIDSVAKLRAMAWVLLGSESYLALEFNRWYLGGNNRLMIDGYGYMDNNCNGIALVTAIGLAFFLALYGRSRWEQAAAAGSAALLGHAILLTYSRGAMLGLLAVGAVTFVMIPKRPATYAAAIVTVLTLLYFSGEGVREEFWSTFAEKESRDESADSRIHLWKACLQSMGQRPLGLGPDHWPLVAHEFGFGHGKQAHTLWLQVGAELGIPGLALLLGYYGSTAARLLPIRRDCPGRDPALTGLACGVIASLAGFAVSAQFVSLKMLEIPYYVAMLGAAVLKFTTPRPVEAVPGARRPPSPGGVA